MLRFAESLGTKIAVYEIRKGNQIDEEKRYFMKDTENFFTTSGSINLKDFKDMYNVIKDDPELLERARFFYDTSEEVKFNPGVIWIEVVFE